MLVQAPDKCICIWTPYHTDSHEIEIPVAHNCLYARQERKSEQSFEKACRRLGGDHVCIILFV